MEVGRPASWSLRTFRFFIHMSECRARAPESAHTPFILLQTCNVVSGILQKLGVKVV